MKATKFFKLKAQWESSKASTQPVSEIIPEPVEEVKIEEPISVAKPSKKKSTNEKQ